jgi:Family of unknown function (DUF6710)
VCWAVDVFSARSSRTSLDLAVSWPKEDPKALPLLARLVGRSAQARTMARAVRQKTLESYVYNSDAALFPYDVRLTKDGRRLSDLKREVRAPRSMDLAYDLIFPWPWNAGRILNCLSKLRAGGEWGQWRQDQNHCIELWLPLGIGWVHGGNHSITTGILNGKGRVRPEVTYDISEVYRHVSCDGIRYRRIYDGKTIGVVPDVDMASVFEIGRLMTKLRVSF